MKPFPITPAAIATVPGVKPRHATAGWHGANRSAERAPLPRRLDLARPVEPALSTPSTTARPSALPRQRSDHARNRGHPQHLGANIGFPAFCTPGDRTCDCILISTASFPRAASIQATPPGSSEYLSFSPSRSSAASSAASFSSPAASTPSVSTPSPFDPRAHAATSRLGGLCQSPAFGGTTHGRAIWPLHSPRRHQQSAPA